MLFGHGWQGTRRNCTRKLAEHSHHGPRSDGIPRKSPACPQAASPSCPPTTTPKGTGMDKRTPKGRFPLRWVAASALVGAVVGTLGVAAAQTDGTTTSTTEAAE